MHIIIKIRNKEFRLSDLLLELESFKELERIRYTTSHPKDMTDDLINVYKKIKKINAFSAPANTEWIKQNFKANEQKAYY